MRYWLAAILALLAGPAGAQQLVPPDEIVIYVNSDVRNTAFVEPLVCALSKIMQAPVRARKIDLALTPDLLATATQFSPSQLLDKFMAVTAGESAVARPFRHMIVDHDMRVPPMLNDVFAATSTAPPASVVSVAQLAPVVEPGAAKTATEINARARL